MTRLKIFLFLIFLGAAAFSWWFVPRAWLRSPTSDAKSVAISVAQREDATSVAELLKTKGITDSAAGYVLYSIVDGSADHPKIGTYRVRPGMSYRTLARMFALGPEREEVAITIVEGWDLGDEAQALAEYETDAVVFSNASRVDSWKSSYDFLRDLPNGTLLEGYLFPDTYRVWKDQLPQSLIKKQLDAFASRATRIAEDAKTQGRTLRDIVILASIVEKEVAKPEDRAIVAGIFWNRLRSGMALQSDATIAYLTDSGRSRSTAEDLAVDSPYNTYRHRGLPPGPISNPGADALDAALHPAKTAYHYFLTDAEGKTYFAKTFEEHQLNRQRAFGK